MSSRYFTSMYNQTQGERVTMPRGIVQFKSKVNIKEYYFSSLKIYRLITLVQQKQSTQREIKREIIKMGAQYLPKIGA